MLLTLKQAQEHLLNGTVIAVPTETVYGLAATIHHPAAIKEIFKIKNRPGDKPLSILFSSFDQLDGLIVNPPPHLAALKKFMPGPLTIILKANTKNVLHEIRRGGTTVGVRMPDHAKLLRLIDKTGPLAAPSANPSDKKPAMSALEVTRYFGVEFPVLDGGPCRVSMASTIIDLTGPNYKILRTGSISSQQILAALKA